MSEHGHNMRVVYIAGPYRSPDGINGIHENIEAARAEARRWWLAGFAVICPHMNTAMMDGMDTDHVFLEGDLEILRRSDIIVLRPNWRESTGATNEFDRAIDWGITIAFAGDDPARYANAPRRWRRE